MLVGLVSAIGTFPITFLTGLSLRSSRKWNTNKFYSTLIHKKTKLNPKTLAIIIFTYFCIINSILFAFIKGNFTAFNLIVKTKS